MVTRTKDDTRKPKSWTDGSIWYSFPHALSVSLTTDEPTCFTQAAHKPKWRAAMTEEINALLKNNTWVLVPPLPTQNKVGCKWVYRIKWHTDGSIDRYKARLGQRDFTNNQDLTTMKLSPLWSNLQLYEQFSTLLFPIIGLFVRSK
ncbi:hypothetical protein ACFX11_003507 [Malus domestica]